MDQERQLFAEAGMLIRKPVEQVFEAFINPVITANFWFSRNTGRLDENDKVLWTWEMYMQPLSFLWIMNFVLGIFVLGSLFYR
jgi:uncharacterized protein YndB with AHSA1/START domain